MNKLLDRAPPSGCTRRKGGIFGFGSPGAGDAPPLNPSRLGGVGVSTRRCCLGSDLSFD